MKQRLLALDVLRGLTIAGMILVNSPGTWDYVYPPLRHSLWNGLTLTDLIFPLFMFMMGVSMSISLRKANFTLTRALFWKIVRRTLTIYVIGAAIYASSNFLWTLREATLTTFSVVPQWHAAWAAVGNTRLLGVLQRLAICYGIGAVTVCTVRHRRLPWLISAILLAYFAVLAAGNGFSYGHDNILSRVDIAVLGLNHMYDDCGIDPEGVLSTLPSVAHVLLGFCVGRMLTMEKTMNERLVRIFVCGSILLMVGLLLQDVCPLNKKVWSPTFVMATCGFGTLLLAVLLWLIDAKGEKRGTWFFAVFGVNPLFCYVLSELLCIFADGIPLTGPTLHSAIYGALSGLLGDNAFASLCYAMIVTAIVWIVGAWLYKKKIYIKI